MGTGVRLLLNTRLSLEISNRELFSAEPPFQIAFNAFFDSTGSIHRSTKTVKKSGKNILFNEKNPVCFEHRLTLPSLPPSSPCQCHLISMARYGRRGRHHNLTQLI